MKAEEINGMSETQLKIALEENRQELFNLRFQVATRKIKNHQRIPQVKKDIARIMTALKERDLMREYTGVDLDLDAVTTAIAPAKQENKRGGLLGRLRGRR
jgi:large subunit ribosomal protein L29